MGQPRVMCTPVRPGPAWLVDRPGLVHWRLLSANNRQLGRSAHAFPDASGALTAVARLAAALLDAEPEVVLLGRRYGWGWTVTLAGEVEAISGRGYERSGLAGHALHLFLTGLPSAAQAPPLLHVR